MSSAIHCPVCGEANPAPESGKAMRRCAACGAALDQRPPDAARRGTKRRSPRDQPLPGLPVRTKGATAARSSRGGARTPRTKTLTRLAIYGGIALLAVATLAVRSWMKPVPSNAGTVSETAADGTPSDRRPNQSRPNAAARPSVARERVRTPNPELERRRNEARKARQTADVPPPVETAPLFELAGDPGEVAPRALADFEAAPKRLTDGIGMELVLLPPTRMLYQKPYPAGGSRTRPLLENSTALIPRPVYVGAREVTREQFESVMGYDPSRHRGESFPVNDVSWHEAVEFCRRLSDRENASYRLPSDAEWELASRESAVKSANLESGRLVAAGKYPADERGLHDLRGNVAEWCREPWVHSDGIRYSARGGSFDDAKTAIVPTFRSWQPGPAPTVGFRIVRELDRAREYDPRMADPALRGKTLLARFDAAFAAPREAPPNPGVLIFPATGLVAKTNVGSSILSQALAAYPDLGSSRKMMDISPETVRRLFALDALYEERYELTKSLRETCLAYLGARMYAVPTYRRDPLDRRNKSWILTVECRGDGEIADRTFEHLLPDARLAEGPGWVAVDVLEFLGHAVTPEQRKKLVRSHGEKGEQSLRPISALFDASLRPKQDNALRISEANLGSVPAWNLFLTESNYLADTLTRPDLLAAARGLGGVEVSLARHYCLIGRPEEAADLLVELVPTHRGDPAFHEALVRYAMDYETPSVVNRFIELWRAEDSGYLGLLGRGELLLEWADRLRRHDQSFLQDDVLSQFRERVRDAQHELEQAAAANPRDWRAHTLLIGTAGRLRLPREYALAHFDAALRHDRPVRAYHELHAFLAAAGSDQDLLDFGRLCAESRLYRQKVPDILQEIIDARAYDRHGALRPDFLRLPELRNALQVYLDSALHDDSSGKATSYWWYWTILAGEPEAAAARAGQFFTDVRGTRFHEATISHFRDIAAASGEDGPERALARVRVALADGDFEHSDHWLERARNAPEADRDEIARLTRALAVGRRLRAERSIELTPRMMLDTFTFHDCTPSIANGMLVCRTAPPGTGPCMICPIGFGSAEVTGSVAVAPPFGELTLAARSQALVNPAKLSFSPRGEVIYSWRRYDLHLNRDWSPATAMPAGVQNFRIRILPYLDRFESGEEFWSEHPVDYDGPGGFALGGYASSAEHEFRVGPVRIHLLGPDPAPPERSWDVPPVLAEREVRRISADGLTVTALALSPRDDELLVARLGGVLSAHDPETGARKRVHAARPDHRQEDGPPVLLENYIGVAVAPDGEVAAGSATGSILTWEPASDSIANTQSSGSTGHVRALVWMPDAKSILCAASHGLNDWEGLYLVTPGRGRGSPAFDDFPARIASLALSPDGTLLLAGADDGAAHLLSLADQRERHRFEGHSGSVAAVAFSPDGKLVATAANRDPIIRVWDPATGALVRVLAGHESAVLALAFSPDGRRLLSGGGYRNPDGPFSTKPLDNSLRLWDVSTGRELLKLDGHADQVNCVLFLPDGKRAFSGGRDGTVRQWNVEFAD